MPPKAACVVTGTGFHSVLEGPSTAPVIVFVHGLAASGEVWTPVAERLHPRFRTLRYDLRSHGRSIAIDAPCSRSDLAADLFAVLDEHGVDRAVVVGHSAGGVIAMQAAVDDPGRVLGLVLVGTASECNDATAGWYRKTAQLARERGGEAALEAMRIRARENAVPDGRGFGHVALAMATLNTDALTDRLRCLRVPTWIVVGEKDFLGVGGSVILSRAIAGSTLDIVPGRGHGIYLEDPDWFAARLTEFVERLIEY